MKDTTKYFIAAGLGAALCLSVGFGVGKASSQFESTQNGYVLNQQQNKQQDSSSNGNSQLPKTETDNSNTFNENSQPVQKEQESGRPFKEDTQSAPTQEHEHGLRGEKDILTYIQSFIDVMDEEDKKEAAEILDIKVSQPENLDEKTLEEIADKMEDLSKSDLKKLMKLIDFSIPFYAFDEDDFFESEDDFFGFHEFEDENCRNPKGFRGGFFSNKEENGEYENA